MEKNIAISMSLVTILLGLNLTVFKDKLLCTAITSIIMVIISADMVSKVLKNKNKE